MAANDYLTRGVRAVPVQSAVLASTSKHLNSLLLRDWVQTHFLRASSPDFPTTADVALITPALNDVLDRDEIEDLIRQERQAWPELDAWYAKGFVSGLTRSRLAGHAPGSVGGILHDHMARNNFEDLTPRFEVKSQYDYFQLRLIQNHDFEHIMCGASFDTLGEVVTYYMRMVLIARLFSPKLAANLNAISLFGGTRLVMRAGLHEPQSFAAALDATRRGIEIGQRSGPIFMAEYEPVLHLPVEEARRALGFAGVVNVDTGPASRSWAEFQG